MSQPLPANPSTGNDHGAILHLNNINALQEAFRQQGKYIEVLELTVREMIALPSVPDNIVERAQKTLSSRPNF